MKVEGRQTQMCCKYKFEMNLFVLYIGIKKTIFHPQLFFPLLEKIVLTDGQTNNKKFFFVVRQRTLKYGIPTCKGGDESCDRFGTLLKDLCFVFLVFVLI